MRYSHHTLLLFLLLLAIGGCQADLPEALPATGVPIASPFPATVAPLPAAIAPTPSIEATRISGAGALVLLNGVLFDGTGAEPVRDAVVVIRDDRIAAVGPRAQVHVPAGARIIDVQGGTILPGFINAHVHMGYVPSNLEAWAQAGVTTVRDLTPSSSLASAAQYYARRDKMAKDPRFARVVGASPMVTAPGGYGSLPVTSVQDARAKADAALDSGADLIKATVEDDLQGRKWQVMPSDQFKAIVETAHARNVPVSVHVSKSQHVEMSLAAGADDLAHMSVDPLSDDLARRVVQAGVYWEPTLELWQAVGWGKQPTENLRTFMRAGGKVALGTDYAGYTTPFQLGMPMHEMEFMQAAGMTPREIILAATKNAAHVCNRDSTLGTLEPDKIADILVVKGNPLEDIHALGDVFLVVHNGVIIRQ